MIFLKFLKIISQLIYFNLSFFRLCGFCRLILRYIKHIRIFTDPSKFIENIRVDNEIGHHEKQEKCLLYRVLNHNFISVNCLFYADISTAKGKQKQKYSPPLVGLPTIYLPVCDIIIHLKLVFIKIFLELIA